jgi:hypothetical protein
MIAAISQKMQMQNKMGFSFTIFIKIKKQMRDNRFTAKASI